MPSITITYSADDGARFAAALGKAHSLMDTQDPPQPRPATTAECKAWLIGRARQLIVDVEGAALTKAALESVVVPPVDMT
jgi:hypothetical protein